MIFLKNWTSLFVGGLTCYALCGASVDEGLKKYTFTGYAQGTDYAITYYADERLVSEAAIDSILVTIDSSMSLYKPYSLINKINANPKGGLLDAHFYQVVRKSFEIYRESKGTFDITVAPLVELWGFGVETVSEFPDSSEVRNVLGCVGMDKMRLKGRRLKKKAACVQLDVNGIAQGYSVDVLATHLEQHGIRHYIVELGGELRIKGPKPDGKPFRVGIERSASGGADGVVINDVIEVQEGAVTTAGNYRKYLQSGEKKVSHHIDPKTGFPFETDIISATIYAKEAITADGYDNVIMAMNAVDAIQFANQHPAIDIFVVYRNEQGSIRDTMSTGFGKLIATKK